MAPHVKTRWLLALAAVALLQLPIVIWLVNRDRFLPAGLCIALCFAIVHVMRRVESQK